MDILLPTQIVDLPSIAAVVGDAIDGSKRSIVDASLPSKGVAPSVVVAREAVERIKKGGLKAEESRARDLLLQRLTAFNLENVVAEAPGYGLGRVDPAFCSPVAGDESRSSPVNVVERGGLAARADLNFAGNNEWFLPLGPRSHRVSGIEMAYPATHTVTEAQQREVQSLQRAVPRTAVPGTPLAVFSTVNADSARFTNKVEVGALLVQAQIAAHALAVGFRPAARPYTAYDVVVAPIAQRGVLQNDPILGGYTELALPELDNAAFSVLAALFSPGGVSNFLWIGAPEDPDNPTPRAAMHSASRLALPGGVRQQLYYTSVPFGRQVVLGGQAFTVSAVNSLIRRLSSMLPQSEVEDTRACAAAHIAVYPPPTPDKLVPTDREMTGARITDHYTTPFGNVIKPNPRPSPDPPRADPNWLPSWDDANQDLEQAPVAVGVVFEVAPERDPWITIEKAVNLTISRDVEWDLVEMSLVGIANVDGCVEATIRFAGDEVGLNARWAWRDAVDPELYHTYWAPWDMRAELGLGAHVIGWWMFYQTDRVISTVPAPAQTWNDGPYTSPRNIYQAIDTETEWLFPTFQPVHVVGMLVGFFEVVGAGRVVRHLEGTHLVRAMHASATCLAWFFSRAMHVRMVDAVALAFNIEQTARFMMAIPYEYRVVVMPRALTRTMYPWGSLEVLEPVPLLAVSNTSAFVGYGIAGHIAGSADLGYVETNVNTEHNALAKLDAWYRATASLVGRVDSVNQLGVVVRFIYTAVARGGGHHKLVHPFGVPFITTFDEGRDVADLFAVRNASEGIRLNVRLTPAFSPFGSPDPGLVREAW